MLLTPSSWITVGRYSEDWDRTLRELMGQHKFEPINKWTAKLGPLTLWIENHPYSSFKTYSNCVNGPIPRRITMMEAMDRYDSDTRHLLVQNSQ